MSNNLSGSLVSVIVPAFKHRDFVEEALNSVSGQNYGPLELIFVDDCSPDDTADVAAGWMARPECRSRFASMSLIRNERNLGAHASLNRGIEEAKGAFVCVLNSDDFFAPERIARMVEALSGSGDRAMAFSAVMPVDRFGEPMMRGDLARQILAFGDMISGLPSVSFGFLRHQLAVSTGNFFFRRTLFDEIGGFRPLKYCHDWDFMLRAIARTEPVFVPEFLYFYRLHETNTFTQLESLARLETEAVLRRYYDEILNGGVRNPLAPSPSNWPGLFDMYMRRFKLHYLWEMMSRTRRPRQAPKTAAAASCAQAKAKQPAAEQKHESRGKAALMLKEIDPFLARQAGGPLRALGEAFRQRELLWRKRQYKFSLTGQEDAVLSGQRPGEWLSLGEDPHFILAPKAGYPAGWTRIHFNLRSAAPCVNPRLYLNTGNGFNEGEAFWLPVTADGIVDLVVSMPSNIRAIRFDPLECEGTFEVDDVFMTEINFFERTALILRRILPLAVETMTGKFSAAEVRHRPVRWRDVFFAMERTYYDVSFGIPQPPSIPPYQGGREIRPLP